MILNDALSTAPNNPARNPNDLRRRLKAAGYEKINYGAYAEVWGVPGHKKVVRFNYMKDPCYLRFAKWVENLESAFLPSIFNIVEMTDDFYYVEMERLYELDDEDKKSQDYIALMSYVILNTNLFGALQKRVVAAGREDVMRQNAAKFRDHNAAKAIDYLSSFEGCRVDLFPRNLMKNDKGHIVINDPVRPKQKINLEF